MRAFSDFIGWYDKGFGPDALAFRNPKMLVFLGPLLAVTILWLWSAEPDAGARTIVAIAFVVVSLAIVAFDGWRFLKVWSKIREGKSNDC